MRRGSSGWITAHPAHPETIRPVDPTKLSSRIRPASRIGLPHASVYRRPPTGQKVGFSSIGLFSNTPPSIVLVVDCCVGAHQRESRSSKLSHDQALSTSSRSSLLALKKGILFGGTSTRAPVFGLRPVRPPRWRVLKVPNPESPPCCRIAMHGRCCPISCRRRCQPPSRAAQ